MMGADIERVLSVLNELKDEISTQIDSLARVSDYRLAMIPHSHSAHATTNSGAIEGVPDGGHVSGDPHVHGINILMAGGSDITNPESVTTGPAGPTHFGAVTDQLTYPSDYTNDKHGSHLHIEHSVLYEAEHPESASSFISPIVAIGVTLSTDIGKMETIEGDLYVGISTFNNGYGSPWKEIYILKEKIDNCENYANSFPDLQWIGEKQSLLSLMQIALSYTVDAKWALITYNDFMQRAYDNEFNGNSPSITWEHFENESTFGAVKQNIGENVNIPEPVTELF